MIKLLPEREKHTIGVAAWQTINELVTMVNALQEVASKLPVIVSKQTAETINKIT